MSKLCWYTKLIKMEIGHLEFDWGPRQIPEGIKRIRVKCPECGRRLLTSVSIDMDGDIYHKIPSPHKVKGWWKKKKPKKKEKRCRK